MADTPATERDDTAIDPVERDDLILVDRLWRSGTSATAVSPSTRGDLGLLQRFLSLDDHDAVLPLLRRHRVATWRLAAIITLDVETAEFVVQESWREVLEGKGAPLGTCPNPRAWLFRVVRRHSIEQGTAPGIELDLGADLSTFPLDQTGDIGLLAAGFSLLDEIARTAVWLHAVEGFDDVDAAYVLGLRRLETHDLIDGAMADLRASAVRAQLNWAGARCRPSLELFPDYLDEDLEPDQEQELLGHLSRCRRCATRMDAVETPGLSLVDRVLAPSTSITDRLRRMASTESASALA